MRWVILPTDALLFLLIGLAIGFAFWVKGHAHLRRAWKTVFLSKRGVVSVTVLLCFASVAVLDSIHLRSTETTRLVSVLDLLLSPLGEKQETTYSAPLAIKSFVKEAQPLSSGETQRVYPRLKYAGQYLNHEDNHQLDLWRLVFEGGAIGALLAALLLAGLFIRFRKHEFWPSIFAAGITLTTICLISAVLWSLASEYHVFGTDKIGQDVFYQSVKSIRTGLLIGSLTTLIMLPFALFFGGMAGFFGGLTDDLIQYLYTTLSSIPGILLIAAAVLILDVKLAQYPDWFSTTIERADVRLLALCAILGVTSWTSLCRLIRAETMKIRELDYVQAAKALGVRDVTIIIRHILPNVMHIALIVMALDFSGLVLAEAVLSYVGVGVDPSTYSWGNMINQARLELAREPAVWWALMASFSLMFILVLFANVFADAVRDAFDPRTL